MNETKLNLIHQEKETFLIMKENLLMVNLMDLYPSSIKKVI